MGGRGGKSLRLVNLAARGGGGGWVGVGVEGVVSAATGRSHMVQRESHLLHVVL